MMQLLRRSLILLLWCAAFHAAQAEDRQEKIQEWLQHQQFEKLDRALGDLQRQFERDRVTDAPLSASFDHLLEGDLPSEDVERTLNDWVTRKPKSYVALLARGMYFVSKGFEARGNRYASETSEAQFEEMRHWFDLGRRDLLATLALSPAPVLSHVWLMKAAMAGGSRGEVEHYLHDGLAYAPKSMALRRQFMTHLEPRWGGSFQQMEDFARASEAVLGPGLATNTLWGLAWIERIDPLLRDGDYRQAHALLSEALAKHGSRRLYCARASASGKLGRLDEAIGDLNAAAQGMTPHPYCARIAEEISSNAPDHPGTLGMLNAIIAANPESIEVRRNRGWLLLRTGDHVKAYGDLSFAAEAGDAWAQAKVAQYLARGLVGPADPQAAVALYRAAAEKGEVSAHGELADLLRRLGRHEEADIELRRYRVSEEARVSSQPLRVDEVYDVGTFRYVLDTRVQAMALAALIMLWIVQRERATGVRRSPKAAKVSSNDSDKALRE